MVRKLKPLRPSVTQHNRVLKQPVGSGFFIYNAGNDKVMVIEMVVDGSDLYYPDGSPFDNVCENGEIKIFYLAEKTDTPKKDSDVDNNC